MPIYHQGRKVKEVFYQGRKVKEIWHMGRRVYSSRPVEVMPAISAYFDAQKWLRSTVQEYGLDYTTVTKLPFDIDTSQVTNMYAMFSNFYSLTTVPQMNTARVTNMDYLFNRCSSLTTVPSMDTSQVTTMKSMFYECSSLTTAPQLDTRNVTDMNQMFRGCKTLKAVPKMDTRNVTNMWGMFYGCSSLTDGNVSLTAKRGGANTTKMIYLSGLTREPFITIA